MATPESIVKNKVKKVLDKFKSHIDEIGRAHV